MTYYKMMLIGITLVTIACVAGSCMLLSRHDAAAEAALSSSEDAAPTVGKANPSKAGSTTSLRVDTPKENIAWVTQYILKNNRKSYPAQARLIAKEVVKTASQYGLPFEYLVALMEIESSFRPWVVSSAECVGLLQVNPAVWVEDKENKGNLVALGILEKTKDLYDPVKNIAAGTYILSHYMAEGGAKGVSNPVRYGIIRYCGKGADHHYEKFTRAMGEFQVARLQAPNPPE